MKTLAHRPRNRRSGLSLLEVMAALAIIALVAGLAAPRVMGAFGRAKAQAAKVELATLKSALSLYYLDVGRYPSEAEGLNGLLEAPPGVTNWHGPYVDGPDALTDPWERGYVYRFPGTHWAFDLMSLGRDGRKGGSGEDSDIEL